ncbi:gp6.1 [Salmonella phage phiSG-JL2]|uniref:Gp6.1 n=1 Tax=Salmonella phage phiSG-JL2 TaxID=529929 RepID=B3FYK1_9CAUD|nr:gp6.1 [Salmonella phage phiSG-JL2]ACD75693.1 gp6.1 [Salmonella phage phiSG-JL2]
MKVILWRRECWSWMVTGWYISQWLLPKLRRIGETTFGLLSVTTPRHGAFSILQSNRTEPVRRLGVTLWLFWRIPTM